MDVKILISTLLVLLTVVIQRGLAEGECMHSCIQQTCNQKKFGPICYYVFNDLKMNWADSRSFCENQHLSMVKITREMLNSGHEVSDILPDIPNPNIGVWLGGKAKDFEKWQFLNNTEVQGLRFDTSDFRGHNLVKCGKMLIDSNSVESDIEVLEFDRNNMDFNTGNCYSKKYFACRLDFDEKNLTLVREEKTWFEAREYCLDIGGDLFYLKASEMQDLSSLITLDLFEEYSQMYVHVGLRHRRWEWIDGTEILYTYWDDNQPDNYLGRCLMMNGDTGKWNDDWCHHRNVVACQGVISDFETSSPSELPPPESNITSTLSMHKSKVAIILGVSLGAIFIIACALTGFLLCRHFKKVKPASPTSADNDANHYEVPVMNEYENDIMANATKFESHFNEMNSSGPASAGNDADHYEVSVRHEYENDIMANATNFESDFSEEKPAISASACNDTDHYEVPVRHEYVNGNMANASSYERLAAPS